jgi:hypothetical protein
MDTCHARSPEAGREATCNQVRVHGSHELVANCDQLSRLKFAKAPPYAFTEHGAIMATSVLNSRRAVEVSTNGEP